MASDTALRETMKKVAIITALPFEGKKVAYLGPRKVDDPPQATFHYGDGKWVMQFHYTKDGKANENSGECTSQTQPEDQKDAKYLGKPEPAIDGGGSIVTGD